MGSRTPITHGSSLILSGVGCCIADLLSLCLVEASKNCQPAPAGRRTQPLVRPNTRAGFLC